VVRVLLDGRYGSARRVIAIAVAGLNVSPAVLFAQYGETDVGEISGYTGVTFGGVGAHSTVGASSGLSLSRYCIGLVDVSYMPLGSDILPRYQSQANIRHSRLYDFNLSGHIRVPLRERWEPYGIVGAGGLYSTFQLGSISGPSAAVTYKSRSTGSFAFETGGGARYYVARTWGVRAEWRCTVSTRTFNRIVTGVFYQFDGQSPFRLRRGGKRGGYWRGY
jgi:opacity protein-like surface antigen